MQIIIIIIISIREFENSALREIENLGPTNYIHVRGQKCFPTKDSKPPQRSPHAATRVISKIKGKIVSPLTVETPLEAKIV